MSVAAHPPPTPTAAGHHHHPHRHQPQHHQHQHLAAPLQPMAPSSSSALSFTAADANGNHFTSPFGDLHLVDDELQAALAKKTGFLAGQGAGVGASSASASSSSPHNAHGMQPHAFGAGGVAANVFPSSGGMTLAGDVSIEDEEGDEDDVKGGTNDDSEEGEDSEDSDDSDDDGGAKSKRKRPAAKSTTTKGKAAAGAPSTARRGSKSSVASSSDASTKGKAKATNADAEATPKAGKGKGKNAGAAATPSKKKAAAGAGAANTGTGPNCEVKGERDSLTGRRKIKIQFIEDDSRRHITFSKRKSGIMKKAYELSVLTGTQVLLLIVSQTGLVFTFTTPKLRPVVMENDGRDLIQRCLTAPDEDDDEAGSDAGGFSGGAGGVSDGGDDDEEDDDDEDGGASSSVQSPLSPSKAPIAIMRPGPDRIGGQSNGPTMTASGSTPKRSGGGTGDGGAAGRRSRAATISNATVRQHRNGVASPEQALAGLSLPGTPVTPSSSSAVSRNNTSNSGNNNNRKRRRTTVLDGSANAQSNALSAITSNNGLGMSPSLGSTASTAMAMDASHASHASHSSMSLMSGGGGGGGGGSSGMPSPRSMPAGLPQHQQQQQQQHFIQQQQAPFQHQNLQQQQYQRQLHQQHMQRMQQQQQQQQHSQSQPHNGYPTEPPNSAPPNMESLPMHGGNSNNNGPYGQIPPHYQHGGAMPQHGMMPSHPPPGSTPSSSSSSSVVGGGLAPPSSSFLFGDASSTNAHGGQSAFVPHMVGTGATPGVGNTGGGGAGGDFFFDPSCLDEIQSGKYGSWY